MSHFTGPPYRYPWFIFFAGILPNLGENAELLETSYDADLLIEDLDDQLAAVLQESIGAEGLFKARVGYHADTLRPIVSETFPRGWEETNKRE